MRDMKLTTKPMSSPGRVEKFYPPQLMRFLRSNVGSRSRGRSSRSSPLMFVRKNINNKNSTSSIETQQEPSSPKVTCMGQVRVRRQAKSTNKTRPGTGRIKPQRRWQWIHYATVCCGKKIKVKPPKSFNVIRPSWPKWVLFLHVKKGKSREEEEEEEEEEEDCTKIQRKFEEKSDFEEEEEEEERVGGYVPRSISPPKNALILTRCRSAPYRSSSLACRFWGSPLGSGEETEQQKQRIDDDQDGDTGKEVCDSPARKRESLSREEETNEELVRRGEKTGFLKLSELEGSIAVKVKELGRTEEDAVPLRPLILTRCKSEPARTAGAKLDPELGFWYKRRLGFT